MTKMVRDAVEAFKELPEDQQETVARAILDYASDDGRYHQNDDERAEVRAGIAEIKRGQVASDEDVDRVYKHMGL